MFYFVALRDTRMATTSYTSSTEHINCETEVQQPQGKSIIIIIIKEELLKNLERAYSTFSPSPLSFKLYPSQLFQLLYPYIMELFYMHSTFKGSFFFPRTTLSFEVLKKVF